MNTDLDSLTVILVHGAWAECASWTPVLSLLQREGLNIACAPLPLTSFQEDVIALERRCDRTEGTIILVGHAYAGAIIGAARNDRIKLLIYVAALAPDEGETVADVFFRETPHPQAPKLSPDSNGYLWMTTEGFEQAFAQDADASTKRELIATQRPINVKCIQEKVPRPTWKDRPSWFLIAENDRMIPTKTQQLEAQRMGATIRPYAVDHSPMLTAPKIVADMIIEAIRADGKNQTSD